MKKISLILILLLTSKILLAQKKDFTINDVVFNSYYSLAPERPTQLNWIKNSNDLSIVENNNLVRIKTNSDLNKNIISLDELNSAIKDSLKRFPRYSWVNNNVISFRNSRSIILFDVNNKSIKSRFDFPKNASNELMAPLFDKYAFTVDNNLFVINRKNVVINITNEGDKNIVSGQSVSRNEFGIKGGIFWSPKGNYLAFYQKDESEVTDYPILETGKAPATVKFIKYPMAGQSSESVKIGVYNFQSDKIVWLKTDGPKDQYLTNVTWGPEEKYIYVAHLNRDQNHLKLFKYNAKTGQQVKLLFEEKDDKYVEPEYPLQFICSKDDMFVWFSEQDSWQHLYLYNTEGKLIKQLTKGDWIVKKIVGADKKNQTIYFISTKDTPIENHLYKLDVKTGDIARLTKLGYSHNVIMSDVGNYFIDYYSSKTKPTVTQVIDAKGKVVKVITESKNPLKNYNISTPTIFSLKGENNIDLYSQIILPTKFDSTKKYPVIVYVYGGPHAQLVTNNWLFGRYDFWFQYMAQHGYIVFVLDNRGSENRGLEFEQAIFRNLGEKEIQDQLVGVDYLKSLPYVDGSRIGVFGWSYGGFMTTSLMLRTNDAFKVGVAGGAVIDWKMYEVMYGERYMDTPESNPEGYKKSNLLNYVENLNGNLLLVHGTSDPTVVWEHTLEFAKKAANLNKPLDYYPYVGHGHGVRGKDALHLYEKISNYFFDKL